MRMENDAKEFYSFNLDRVTSPDLKSMFEELVEMEKNHYAILEIMRERFNVQDPPISISWVVDNVSKEVNPPIIADNSDVIADERAISDLSIVRLAYLMESDYALFYRNAALQVEDKKAKDFLLELSKWEDQHRDMFKTKYEELLKQHWSDVTNIIFN